MIHHTLNYTITWLMYYLHNIEPQNLQLSGAGLHTECIKKNLDLGNLKVELVGVNILMWNKL